LECCDLSLFDLDVGGAAAVEQQICILNLSEVPLAVLCRFEYCGAIEFFYGLSRRAEPPKYQRTT